MDIKQDLYSWLVEYVNGSEYGKLLEDLHDTMFIAMSPLDENRIFDGINARYRFADAVGISRDVIDSVIDNTSCSVLEMMIGLAIRIEDTIMGDEEFGNRTIMWFWMMIKSMGLYNMTNSNIYGEHEKVKTIITNFLNKQYKPNGEGGLFTIRNTDKDLRDYDIWRQMCWFYESLI